MTAKGRPRNANGSKASAAVGNSQARLSRKLQESINPAFTDMDMRTFPGGKEQDAWEWLEAAPAGKAAR